MTEGPSPPPPGWVLLRAVRILMECILVLLQIILIFQPAVRPRKENGQKW